MRRAIFLMILAIVSGGAGAEWVVAGRDETWTVYFDPATIRRTGDIVKMWRLFDFRTTQVREGFKPFMSSRGQHEYDCKEERARMLSVSWHSGSMTSGDVVASTSNPGSWDPVPPDSTIELLWQMACGKS